MWCCDWRAFPPTGPVDLVLADPPFSEHVHAGHAVELRNRAAVEFAPGDPAGFVGDLLFRCPTGWVVCFCAGEQLGDYEDAAGGRVGKGGRYVRGGLWLKTNPMPQITGDRPGECGEHLAIMHGAGMRMSWNRGGGSALWIHPSAKGLERQHQTPKPVGLMMMLLADFAPRPYSVVWDPMAGSGTTGVACIRTGHRFIGHECDPYYFWVAVERLRIEEQNLFATNARQRSIHELELEAGDAMPSERLRPSHLAAMMGATQ